MIECLIWLGAGFATGDVIASFFRKDDDISPFDISVSLWALILVLIGLFG